MDLAKFVVLVIVCIAALGYLAGRKGICPSCHIRALKNINSMKATVFVKGLGLVPDSWSFHQCETCSTRYKQHRGQWIRLSADEWRKEMYQPPDAWRAITRMRTGFGDIDVWRSEDQSWLRIKQVKKNRAPALLYWTLAATGESVVPADARMVGMLAGTQVISIELPATDGFLMIWSETGQEAVASFALKDLP